MNYQLIYEKLIERAVQRKSPAEPFEKHHIIPKHLGGSNKKENLVKLTLREHFVCHLLLAKIHGGGMWFAAWIMSNSGKYGSRKYAFIRKHHKTVVSKPKSEETKAKMRKPKSPEHRARMSEAFRGREQSEEKRRKISEAHKGRVLTEEHKKKIGSAQRGKPNITKMEAKECPYCRRSFTPLNFGRYHGEKCKGRKTNDLLHLPLL